MNKRQMRLWSSVLLGVTLLLPMTGNAGEAKNKESDDQRDSIPTAVVTGLAGETYVFYGTGGITVDENPRPGMWHSNMKTYRIRIDGSEMSGGGGQGGGFPASNFAAASVNTDFQAFPNTAYFVSASASCVFSSASTAAGREIVVCNSGKDVTIKYDTTAGETISGNASGTLTNASPYKVDRFISDGKNWYKE